MKIEKYAEQILLEKNLEVTKENKVKVLENLSKRLEKKYNAVCIGIDETLLDNGTMNKKILQAIYNILEKHISLVLITGRGETGLKAFNTDLCEKLINEYEIQKEKLKNIIGVTHNGEFLFYTCGDKEFLDSCTPLVSEDELKNLKHIESDLDKFFVKKLADVELITSKSPLYDGIAAFRLMIHNGKQFEKVEQYLREFVNLENNILKANIKYSIRKISK